MYVMDFSFPLLKRGRLLASVCGCTLLCFLFFPPELFSEQRPVAVNRYRVEAAFLRNFAHYVAWPSYVFDQVNTPWNICILGPNPFNDFLETTFAGRSEQGRTFNVIYAEDLDLLPPCQIVFITFQDPEKRRSALEKLRDKPVLTVSEASGFLQEGGIIELEVGERISMHVNLDQANYVALHIQTKMLEVSENVLENGKVRKMR